MSEFRLTRPAVAKAGPPADAAAVAAASPRPALTAHLTVSAWEDGEERVTSSVTLFMGQQMLQAALNDRDGGLVAFVTGTSLDGLLDALETGLQRGSLDWRASGQRSQGRSRRK